jgi:hypothetical protein
LAPDYDILNAITISAWIYADSLTGSDGIISKRTSTEVAGNWTLRVDNNNPDRLEWMVWDGSGGSDSQLSNASSISTGAWIHVAMTFDDPTNMTRFYFNGTPDASGTAVAIPLADNGEPIAIGWAGQGSQYFDGRIDDVRIYDRVLSSAEISALAASPPVDCGAGGATPGDYLIRRNDLDSTTTVTTADLDALWDLEVASQGSSITYSAGTFTLAAGKYLVMWSERFDSSEITDNTRVEIQGRLVIGGTESSIGAGQTYIRKLNDQQAAVISGAGIIDIASDDTSLLTRFRRTDTSIDATVARVVDWGGVTILTLDDTWNYGRYSLNAETATVGGAAAFEDIVWSSTDEEETGFSRSGADITITNAGRYLVTYSIPITTDTGADRTEYVSRMRLNNTTEIEGSRVSTYMRESQGTNDGVLSYIGIIDVGAGDVLSVEMLATDGTITGDNMENGSSIQILQLPAGNETIIVEATTGEMNPLTLTEFAWDTTPHIDASAFTDTSPTDSFIEVDVNDDYLFFATHATDNGGARTFSTGRFSVNDTLSNYAAGGQFNRSSGADAAGYSFGSLLTGLSAGDDISLENIFIEVTQSSQTLNHGAMSGLRLGSIFVADTTPDAFDFTDQTDVAVSTPVESDIVQVTGMDNGTAISIDGGGSYEYRICADGTCSGAPAYTSTAGTIDSGQYVQLRLTSSASSSTATVATLTVGTANVDWSVTTAADNTPDAFDFTDQTDVAVSTPVESDIVQVTGMDNGTAISIDGGGSYEYRICADGTCSGAPSYVSTSGTIDSGEYVQLRLTSSASNSTATVATLTVGTANVDWSVTTVAGGGGGISYVGSNGNTGTSTTLDIGTAGTDRLVVVIADDESQNIDLTGVTVDGKPCHHVATANNTQDATGNHQEMWYCDEDDLGASSGSVPVVITGGDAGWAIHAHLYTGVDQGGPTDYQIDDTSFGQNEILPAAVDIPANGLVVFGAANGQSGSYNDADWDTNPSEGTDDGLSPEIEMSEVTDGPHPSSAILATAYWISSTGAQTNRLFRATGSVANNRGTGIVASWGIAIDNTPDAFDFTDQTDVTVSTPVESDIVQVTGMDNGTTISIDGVGSSEYRICADGTCSGAPAYTSTAGTIDSGQYVQLRLTSSASYSTATVATLTVGTANVDWSVTTEAAPATTLYRSIGTNTGTLYNTGNASIDSGTTTVTFGSGASLPVPTAVGAVGLGDKLVIGSETFYILSRDDDTHVTVQTAATSTHTDESYTRILAGIRLVFRPQAVVGEATW